LAIILQRAYVVEFNNYNHRDGENISVLSRWCRAISGLITSSCASQLFFQMKFGNRWLSEFIIGENFIFFTLAPKITGRKLLTRRDQKFVNHRQNWSGPSIASSGETCKIIAGKPA
jgi:hypothetical protein